MTTALRVPAKRPKASPGSLGSATPGGLARASSADLVRLAVMSCSAAFGAVSVVGEDGVRVEDAYGFEPATVSPASALCRRVLAERRAIVADVDPDGASPGVTVRWFAGAPVIAATGDLLGVIWVADTRSRRSTDAYPGQILAAFADNLAMAIDLRRVRSQYESALGLIGEAAFRCGADGLLKWVSPSWATVTGHSAATTLGQPLSRFFHGDIAKALDELMTGEVGKAVRRVECRLVLADSGHLPVELALARHSCGDGAHGVIGAVSDLRERQQRELEARHDQKLESLGRLSAGIAHEINTPIQFVGDNTRFLANAYQDMLKLLLVYRECMRPSSGEITWDERIHRAAEAEREADIDYLAEEVPAAVQQSLEGVERVASLVRAMKAFSYKDTNGHSYADLNEALRTTVTVARNEVKYVADVTLDLGDLPDVMCVVGDLNQVFLNLLVNSADAIRDINRRGEIRITTRVEGPNAVVSIADNGIGIPEHLQRTIFEPFFTTKDVGKGTGQGLALARTVVYEKHGGTIEVRSRPGEGTEFVVRLPVNGSRGASR